ncbi:MAG TPA: hypothetical protein VK445_05570 [Dissulfurispiraceae bacterium]|nr:hypothetical protein [Dissulfurispiraceae bacterium]
MIKHLITSFFIALLFLFPAASAPAAEEETRVPYDENTELTVRGTVMEVSPATMRGPVTLQVQVETKSYRVFLAPRWFVLEQGLTLTPGQKIEVTGSKFFSRDGAVSLSATRIRFLDSGKEVFLRDDSCRPLWMQHRHGRFGR